MCSNYFAERAFKILINLVEYKVCWKASLEVSEFFGTLGGREGGGTIYFGTLDLQEFNSGLKSLRII